MLRVGSEPTIPVFDRAKTVHALDPATPVIALQGHMHRVIVSTAVDEQ
jgi:hypothetical protein